MPPSVIDEMEEMFLRLGFSKAVVLKLVEDQGIDYPWTLASLSDEDIDTICDMIHRPGGLVVGKTLDRGNQISLLATKNQTRGVNVQDIFPRSTGFKKSTSHLCWTTNINGSLNRRNQTTSRRPKFIKTIGQRLWGT